MRDAFFPSKTIHVDATRQEADRRLHQYLSAAGAELLGETNVGTFKVWRAWHRGVTFVVEGSVVPASQGVQVLLTSRLNRAAPLLWLPLLVLVSVGLIAGVVSADLRFVGGAAAGITVLAFGLLWHREEARAAMNLVESILKGGAA